jgi:ribosomal protein S1
MAVVESDQDPMAAVRVGDLVAGSVAGVTSHGVAVALDGFGGAGAGLVGCLDYSWRGDRGTPARGERISAEVIAVDRRERQIRLSRAATENPELWAFLKTLQRGQLLSGTVVAIESYGVFVDLDDGPGHPCFAGVGFVTMPELSWRHFTDPAEVIALGQRVTGEFLAFDTSNGEARMSIRATQPDPFRDFARAVPVGHVLRGEVTKLVPFGVFVRVRDGVEGLVHRDDLGGDGSGGDGFGGVNLSGDGSGGDDLGGDDLTGGDGFGGDGPAGPVLVGDEITVTVADVDLCRRRLTLKRANGR